MSLCHSAFARVATRQVPPPLLPAWFCHSAFVRVATPSTTAMRRTVHFATAHSCGLRRIRNDKGRKDGNLCHSAFVRVATRLPTLFKCALLFATAHSCGLRQGEEYKKMQAALFATAHSCGLRRVPSFGSCPARPLCHSAFVRVATKIIFDFDIHQSLCHSAFVRVATAEKQCSALRICCEKVDSFSSVGESGLALTIFPFSFAAKATYVAINDSFGRAIDRFFGANRTGISVSYDFAEHPCL